MAEVGDPRDSVACEPRFGGAFSRLGPGIVSGISDDDPSAIGTYAQLGASLGFRLVWSPVAILPFITGAQIAASRIAVARGRGLVAAARDVCPRWLLVLVFGPVVVANVFTLGADLDVMASALDLILGIGEWLGLALITLVSVGLIVGLPYHRYRRVLMVLSLAIFAFVAVVFVADIEWSSVADSFALSGLQFDRAELAGLIAAVGATASPFVIVWHANTEVAETSSRGGPGHRVGRTVDVLAGLVAAVIAAMCVLIATATALPPAGITSVRTVDEAARGLEPLLGSGAQLVFSLGIVGVGLLAVPVLAIGAANVVSELVGWPTGLGKHWRDARGFYLLVAGAVVVALSLRATGIPPVRALFFASIANGLAVPLLFLTIAGVARSRRVMGRDRVSSTLGLLVATGGLAAAALPILYLATA